MLEVQGLKKSFGHRPVLTGLDLSVGPGESVALLGGNGSGKTTTLRAVVGLSIPDGGTIYVGGVDAIARPRQARRRLSFLPQKSVFPPVLTVRETLTVAARLRGVPERRIDEELAHCELDQVADLGVGALSGGQRQRLGLAVSLLPDAGLYLFDEPTANLDPRSLEIFFESVRRLRRESRAILFTTHITGDVEALATRVEVLEEGRVRAAVRTAWPPAQFRNRGREARALK